MAVFQPASAVPSMMKQQQGDDDKINEMDMVSIKRRWGNGCTTHI
jgi:hypothetical protein